MRGSSQAAFTLLETLTAVALLAIAIGAFIGAVGAFGRFATHQAGPVHVGALLLAEQTLRTAQDAWKYGSPGVAPFGSWDTTVPLAAPGAMPTSVPVKVTTSVANVTAQGAQISVSVQYTPDPQHAGDTGTVSLTGQARVSAPLPGTALSNPSLIPQPSGAP